MTTSRSSFLLAALLAGPAAAQDLTLPSGLSATLYDVVLEAGARRPLAPDAFTDPEAEDAGDSAAEGTLAPAAPAGTDAATGGLARFRLAVAGLGEAGFERVAGDFAWVCESLALPALAANGWRPTEVVVSLSDRELAFGASDPDAVQFFEGFRIDRGACVPQAF